MESIGASVEDQSASVNAEPSVRQNPTNFSSTSLSRAAQKRAKQRLAKLKGAGGIKNDDNISSESEMSREYFQSHEGLQDQLNALVVEVQSGFSTRDKEISDLSESIASIKTALESLAIHVRVITQDLKTKTVSGHPAQGVSISDFVFESQESPVPVLSAKS